MMYFGRICHQAGREFMQAVDSAGMAVASAYAVGALFNTLVANGILTREQAGAALHDALTALGHRTGTPEGLQASEIISAWSRNLPKQY
jgi:hypothetical protein